MPATVQTTRLVRDWDAFARNYHAESVTPFARGVRFRLPADLRRLLREWRSDGSLRQRLIVDFGCGPGDALELVAGRVGCAVGIDFSPKMLRCAAERLGRRGVTCEHAKSDDGLKRIRGLRQGRAHRAGNGPSRQPRNREVYRAAGNSTILIEADLRRLRAIRGLVDAGMAINSICAPTVRDARRMFREIAASIRPGGTLFVVWPALDSLEYLLKLESRNGRLPESRGESLLPGGIHEDSSGYRLKLFGPDEIRRLCDAAALTLEVMEKIQYPWSYMRELGWGYHPRRPRLWDWYVVARAG